MANLFGPITQLSALEPGDQGDCYVLLAAKERGQTRDGKPYFRVTFRDHGRSVTSMIWSDGGWFADCDTKWQVGQFYKIRGAYFENQYGPQLDLEKIRPLEQADREQGFDPADFFERSRFEPRAMYDELLEIVRDHISEQPLQLLVRSLLEKYADQILRMSAASRNHHAFTGGFLEHVLSVTRTGVQMADKYTEYYPDLQPPLSKSLIVAGAILHDIGKLIELDHQPSGAEYTPAGRLIGHILLGRDLVREQAREIADLNPETLLRLEHIIVAHQNLPEWGSPVAPHTLEALIVHMADDLDAKVNMFVRALAQPGQPGEAFTGRDNPLGRRIFRGLPVPPEAPPAADPPKKRGPAGAK